MLQNESISNKIYDILKQDIVTNQLAPDARLVISSLSQRFGISAIPVREALFRLAAEKLIVLEHNKGFKVASKPNVDDIQQWRQARLLIEPCIAESVIANITDAQIDELKQLNREMRQHAYGPKYEQYSFFINANSDFHKLIVGSCGNRLVVEMYNALNYGPQVGRFHNERGVPDITLLCNEHDMIISAIENRNVEDYRSRTTDHITLGFDRQLDLSRIGSLPDTQAEPSK